MTTTFSVYAAAREAWMAAAGQRERRRRFKNYTYGRQWDDPVRTPSGDITTEGQLARSSGKTPLTNNMIRQLVKSVVGRFRHMLAQSAAQPSADAVRNQLDELDCRLLEEFLISGCAVQRIVSERRPDGAGVWVDNVSPDRFFVNAFTDPRGSDIELCGMLHDMSLHEVMMRLGHNDPARCEKISRIYSEGAARAAVPFSVARPASASFESAGATGRCRVIEVWALEGRTMLRCHDRNDASVFFLPADADTASLPPGVTSAPYHTLRWHGYWYAPGGELLYDTDSPWAHGRHPFAIKFYPLTDGEVHSFVEDVIDQQRAVNRLITLIDQVLGISAKGVLLFPENQKPYDMTWQQVADQWARPGGIVRYSGINGIRPEQISSGPGAAGAYELLNTELRLFDRISGVGSALQGRDPASATTGADLYRQQAENASIALLDTFETFNSFRRARDAQMKACRIAHTCVF